MRCAAHRDRARENPTRRTAHRQGALPAHGPGVPEHGRLDHARAGAPSRADEPAATHRAFRVARAARGYGAPAAGRRCGRMSRLDSFIRRLEAQRACLNRAAALISGIDGIVLELGLGNGRTYDHLRELFADRDIYVCERRVAAHPACVPPPEFLIPGDMRETLPGLGSRIGGRGALAPFHAGAGGRTRDLSPAARTTPAIPAPLGPGRGVG